MDIKKIYTNPKNKWGLIIEGIEKGKPTKTLCTIPPTKGDRFDLITEFEITPGYRYDCKGIIIIDIIQGDINLKLIK